MRELGLSTADLARRARARPQSMAHAVARLEEMGLIVRRPHPEHGRVVQLYPTEAGRRVLAESSEMLAAFERELTQDLSEAEVQRLFDRLETLRSRADQLSQRVRRRRAGRSPP